MCPKCPSTLICCAYREPAADFNKLSEKICEAMTRAEDLDKCDFVLLGELNMNLLPNINDKNGNEKKNF